jgi:hypothetical protein
MTVTTPFQVCFTVLVSRSHVQNANPLLQTLFAVPMTCESCVKDISSSLYKLGGISKVEANLKDQLVSIEGTGSQIIPPHLLTFGIIHFMLK